MSNEDINSNMRHITIHKAKKAWYKRFWVWALVLIVLASIGAATNNNSNAPTVTNSSNSGTAGSTNSGSKSPAPTAKVGDTLTLGGSKGLAVTLVNVIDPATGADQFTTPDAGKRFVAVDLKILNNGSSAYNDDANNDVTIIGSDNQSYTDDFNNVAECTNFDNGSFTLAAGESVSGCVNFQLPNAVTASKVQFTANSGFSGNTGEWSVQ